MLIGKAKKPRCFKNIDVTNLPVIWRSNKKSWMTEASFIDWIQSLNKIMFFDNATSHSHELQLSNVKLSFLPVNCTSKLQPLDLGIIRAFKARYRKMMLSHLISNIENCVTVTELTKQISVLDAINWINKSWNDTNASTVVKCFRDAGFPTGNLYANDPDDDIPLIHLLYLQKKIPFKSLDEITDIENTIPTEETYDGDWEQTMLDNIKDKENICGTSTEYESDEDDEPLLESKSKTHHTYETLLDLLKGAREFGLVEDDTYLDPVENLITITEKNIVQQKLSRKRHQSNLDNFVEQI